MINGFVAIQILFLFVVVDIANSNMNTIAPAIFITMKAIKAHGKNAKSVENFLKKSNIIQS